MKDVSDGYSPRKIRGADIVGDRLNDGYGHQLRGHGTLLSLGTNITSVPKTRLPASHVHLLDNLTLNSVYLLDNPRLPTAKIHPTTTPETTSMLQSANTTHGTEDSRAEALPEAGRPVRILIAPDKFKGCLNAIGVADAIRSGVESAANGTRFEVTVLPLADGGDGSVEAAVFAGSRPRTVEVTGADGEMTGAQIAFDGTTAVVEVAGTCGLGTLRGALRPLSASSRGLGEAILAAAQLKPQRIVVAMGGSASTDGGTGMLAALGAEFRDARGNPVEPDGGSLDRIVQVDLGGVFDFGGTESSAPATSPTRSGDCRVPHTFSGRRKGRIPPRFRCWTVDWTVWSTPAGRCRGSTPRPSPALRVRAAPVA